MLAEYYELRDRQLAIERKLMIISKTAQTILDTIQTQRTLRVEWYIVILIVVDIVISLTDKFMQ